jgi:uncharacterized membrane protein YfcA
MRRLVLLGIVGIAAQLVDGALGMAYGVTSTTLLLSTGVAPAAASASVHLAELGTTLFSGAAHWRFGNVNWRVVGLMTFPGAVGAFFGAVVLSSLSAELAKPLIATFLFGLGVYILIRFSRKRVARPTREKKLPWFFLSPLGLFAGFMDAAGGGGWGPISTPTLLSSGRLEPRRVVGSVDTGEFLVALGASLGFIVGLSLSAVHFEWVLALLAGGLVAAPIAAWLVRKLPARVLGAAVAGIILLTNAKTLGEALDLEAAVILSAYLVLTAVSVAALAHAVVVNRRENGHLADRPRSAATPLPGLDPSREHAGA